MKKKILFLGFIIGVFVTLMILPASAKVTLPDISEGCDACVATWFQIDHNNHCDSVCECSWAECPQCGKNTVLIYCNRTHMMSHYNWSRPSTAGTPYEQTSKCSKCGLMKTVTAVYRSVNCDTQFSDSDIVPPTCISWGYTKVSCEKGHTDCREAMGLVSASTWNFVAPLTEHDIYFSRTVAATCTSDGYDEYKCTNCSMIGKQNVVPATGHTPSGEGVVTLPTCQEEGYTTHTCSRCNQSYRDNFVPKVDHNYTSKITKDNSCTEDGVRTYTCSFCAHSYTEVIPKLGHVTTTKARITETGALEIYDVCILCFEEFLTDAPCHNCVPHKYSCECGYGWIADTTWNGLTSSATVLGRLDYSDSCSGCGATFTFSVWQSHYYVRKIIDGKIYDICDNCGSQIYIADYNPDVGGDEDPDCVHDYARTYYPPTCIDRGYYMYVCIKCSSSYIDSYVDALGHDPQSNVVAPTCIAEGYTDNVCKRDGCGEDWISDRVPPLGHNFINGLCTRCGKNDKCVHTYLESVIPPSCHDFGYTLYTCTQCGDTYMDNYTKQLTHQWRVDGVRNPTCELFGYKELTCTLCGEFDTEDIAPYGHKWAIIGSEVQDDHTVNVTSRCTSCGKSKVENLPTEAAQAQNWLLTVIRGLFGGLVDSYEIVANGVTVGGVTAGEVISGCLIIAAILVLFGFALGVKR